MLPTGHIAAGFLTAHALIKILKPDFDANQINQLLALGAFWGFAPDLDVFYSFARQGNLLVSHKDTPVHHKFFSHAPMAWLVPGLLIYFLGASDYAKMFGLVFWLGTWSHFVLDSVEYGIMWLWPINNKIYALSHRGQNFRIDEKNFFRHSIQFLFYYSKRVSFYLEVLIIILALIVYFKVI